MAINEGPDLADIIYEYAGSDPDKWANLKDWPIQHTVFGVGRLAWVEKCQKDIILHMVFDHLPPDDTEKQFLPSAFTKGYFTIEMVPDHLVGLDAARDRILARIQAAKAEEERLRIIEQERQKLHEEQLKQALEEAESTKEFLELQNLFGIHGYENEKPSSPLYLVLLKLHAGERFSKEDCDWLERKHLNNLLALYYQSRYQIEGDLWNIAKAGKYWRMAGLPNRVLELQFHLSAGDSRACAAVLTNRGAALRDTGRLEEARKLAIASLEHDPHSYHAFNLLGAINFQMGDMESGEDCFSKALELGASSRSQEDALKIAIKNAPADDRKRTARYLLSKDPQKYAWANYYLN